MDLLSLVLGAQFANTSIVHTLQWAFLLGKLQRNQKNKQILFRPFYSMMPHMHLLHRILLCTLPVVCTIGTSLLAQEQQNRQPADDSSVHSISLDTYYTTTQTVSYTGPAESFQERTQALVVSSETSNDNGQQYQLFFAGGVTYPSTETPTFVISDKVVVSRMNDGTLETTQPSLVHSIEVINEAVTWAVAHSLPENTPVQIPIDIGNGLTTHVVMIFDMEPVDIGASDDTKLVTVKTRPRMMSGLSGLFQCEYKSMFIYSPKQDKLYQSTSIFTANTNSGQLRVEELTYMTDREGDVAKYALVNPESRLGKLSSSQSNSPMQVAPPAWVVEALRTRDSLYCAGKAIVYEKTNWVYLSAFIIDTTYSLVQYAWSAVAGESFVTSVSIRNPNLGSRLQRYDVSGVSCASLPPTKASNIFSTPALELTSLGAIDVAFTPDSKPTRVPKTNTVAASGGTDWLTTSLMIGGGVAVAAGVGGSSGGGSAGECANVPLMDDYLVAVTSICMGSEVQDITFSLSLNANCTVTGTASVFGGAPIQVESTTWSYNNGTLKIGSYSTAVASSATVFTTPLEQIFPSIATAILTVVPTLPGDEIQEILVNCTTPENYVSNLTMTWTKE